MPIASWIETTIKNAQNTAEDLWFKKLGVREVPSSERYLVAAVVAGMTTKNVAKLTEDDILAFLVKRLGGSSLAEAFRDSKVRDTYGMIFTGIREAYRRGDQTQVRELLTHAVVRPADWGLGFDAERVLASESAAVSECISSIGFLAETAALLHDQGSKAQK